MPLRTYHFLRIAVTTLSQLDRFVAFGLIAVVTVQSALDVHGTNQHTKEEVENFPPPEGKTRDLVAKATGFGNGKTYEQAKKVVQQAVPLHG